MPTSPNTASRLYSRSVKPTQDSRVLLQAARTLLHRIYRQGYRYKRAGVLLLELTPEAVQQRGRRS